MAHFEYVGTSVLPNAFKKSESGVIHLVRTACKALCKHASEQSGVHLFLQLLKAVYNNIQLPEFVAGSRALGLIK